MSNVTLTREEADALQAAIEAGAAEITRLAADLNAERLALHRLRTEMQAVDVRHIRLRDGLRRALGAWQAHLTGLEKRLVGGPDGGTRAERAEIAELRKLLGPEGA